MARAAKRAATYDDLLKVPDPLVAEIVDGDLFTTPRPALRHADEPFDSADLDGTVPASR